jgi:cob(I)alamin adenosyltransferase
MKKTSQIFTRIGDKGATKTLQGEFVPKDDCLIEVNGDIDSLQACLDKILAFSNYSEALAEEKEMIMQIQMLLWQMGGEISQGNVGGFVNKPIEELHVDELESSIEKFSLYLDGFQRFKSMIAIEVNEARVRTRKLERTLTNYLREREIRSVVYKYVNRLSDYFFALSVRLEKEGLNL